MARVAGPVVAHLPGHLGRHHLGLGGHQGLTNLPRLLEALLLGDRLVRRDGDGLTRLRVVDYLLSEILTDLSRNVDTLLPLDLDGDGDALLRGDVLADLLAVVAPAVVLQVHDPTLYVRDALDRLW